MALPTPRRTFLSSIRNLAVGTCLSALLPVPALVRAPLGAGDRISFATPRLLLPRPPGFLVELWAAVEAASTVVGLITGSYQLAQMLGIVGEGTNFDQLLSQLLPQLDALSKTIINTIRDESMRNRRIQNWSEMTVNLNSAKRNLNYWARQDDAGRRAFRTLYDLSYEESLLAVEYALLRVTGGTGNPITPDDITVSEMALLAPVVVHRMNVLRVGAMYYADIKAIPANEGPGWAAYANHVSGMLRSELASIEVRQGWYKPPVCHTIPTHCIPHICGPDDTDCGCPPPPPPTCTDPVDGWEIWYHGNVVARYPLSIDRDDAYNQFTAQDRATVDQLEQMARSWSS